MKKFLNIFVPNASVSGTVMVVMTILEFVIILAAWAFGTEEFPGPLEVVTALVRMFDADFARNLLASFYTNLQAIALTTGLSLLLSYATVMWFSRPMVWVITKFRFVPLVVLVFLFTRLTGGGHALKLTLLVVGMSTFFVTSMCEVVDSIPKEEFEHARSLRMNEWRVVWEVVVLGRFDQALEVMRNNSAIGWMMLTMVEGLVKSEGGIGKIQLTLEKHLKLPEMFATVFVVCVIGIIQDRFFGWLKDTICPYAKITTERK